MTDVRQTRYKFNKVLDGSTTLDQMLQNLQRRALNDEVGQQDEIGKMSQALGTTVDQLATMIQVIISRRRHGKERSARVL